METARGNVPLQDAAGAAETGQGNALLCGNIHDDLLDVGEWSALDVDLLSSWIAGDDDMNSNSNDDGSTTTGSSPPTTTSPLSGTTPATESRDRNPTRQRQRQELMYLRSRVDEMERELAQLRGETAIATATTAIPSEWEAIAKRQQKAREKSELENVKLRGMLESQLKLARTLERLLRKRDHASSLDSRHTKRPRAVVDGSSVQTDHEVFERLLSNIDRSYAETAAALTANGLWTAPRGHRRVEVKHAQRSRHDGRLAGETMHELYVEMTDVTTLPFSMEATARAAWKCITSGYMQLDHEIYKDLTGREDVLAIKYGITLSRRRLHIDFSARAAMKRFVASDQIVDVWESISDTAGSHTSPRGVRGIQVRERGWTVFRCVDGDPTRTLQLTCMQMMPLISYNVGDFARSREDRQVGLLTNLALDYYGDQIDLAQHAMESLLMDEARDDGSDSLLQNV